MRARTHTNHTINRRIKPNEKCNDMPDVHFVQDADVVVVAAAERTAFTICELHNDTINNKALRYYYYPKE